MSDITRILNDLEQGDPHAANQLLSLVYEELRRLAAQRLAREMPGQTLQPTALVHEAYLRLVGQGNQQPWQSRGHFFAAAAEAMRRILVEIARRKKSDKHGGGLQRHDVADVPLKAREADDELLALDEALDKLARVDPVKVRLVQLRYFAGLTIEEAAEVLGISISTAKRSWAYSRAWLYHELREAGDVPPKGA